MEVGSDVMAAGRARADYDYLIKLLLIGDSGMCFVLHQIVCGLIVCQNVHRRRECGA